MSVIHTDNSVMVSAVIRSEGRLKETGLVTSDAVAQRVYQYRTASGGDILYGIVMDLNQDPFVEHTINPVEHSPDKRPIVSGTPMLLWSIHNGLTPYGRRFLDGERPVHGTMPSGHEW